MSSTRWPRFEQQLGGEVALLGELGVVERLLGMLEIGAAVLPVGIEEQRIEPAVEIVVMRDVAPRAAGRIELRAAGARDSAAAIAGAPSTAACRSWSGDSASARKSAIEPCSITSVPSM